MRHREIILLIIVALALYAGFSVLTAAAYLLTLSIMLPFFILSLSLHYFAPHGNQYFLPLASLLTGIGLLNLYQLDTAIYQRQYQNFLLSTVIALVVLAFLKFNPSVFRYRYTAGLLGVLLLVLPAFIGVTRGGARLWINIAGLTFQPAEFAKILLFIFLSAYFAEHRLILRSDAPFDLKRELKYLGPALLVTLFSLLSLVYVKDLGFSFLLLVLFLAALYLSTARNDYVIASVTLFMAGAYGAYHLFSHVKTRIDIWLNPWLDVYGSSYQLVQSLFAYAEGGVVGRGLGNGFPQFVPAAHTDMVLPVLSETTGITGPIVVFSAYLLIAAVALHEANRLNLNREGIFLALAGFSLFFQAFLVAAGTTGLLPLTGLTTPFMSYGGSSLTASFILLACMLFFSEKRKKWIVR